MENESSEVPTVKIKLLMLGDNCVGKSYLHSRFLTGKWPEHMQTTIGVDFSSKTVQVDKKFVKVQLWDTSGNSRFDEITKSCIRGSHGLLIVYDVTREVSFYKAKYWLEFVRKEYKNTAVILCGHKADPSGDDRRVISKDQGRQLADSYEVDLVEASAKECFNVEAMFYHLTALAFVNQQETITQLSQSLSPPGKHQDFRNRIDLPVVTSVSDKKKNCEII